MLSDFFHRLMLPTVVTTILATVWIVGWSQALADVHGAPPLPVPGYQTPASHVPSLHKILLKDNQIVGVG